jgi:glycosyltransferase involved in cell wall biosynthesis
MTRILLVSATGQLGGAERSLIELATAINPAEFQLFAAVGGNGPLAAQLDEAGVHSRIVEMLRLQRTVNPLRLAEYVAAVSRASRAIAELASSLEIDIVHANTDMAQVYAGEAAARAGIPCVWHARDMLNLGPIGERMAKQAHRVLAISEAVRDHLARAGIDDGTLRLVRNGIACARFPEGETRRETRKAVRTELGLNPFAFVAGSVGALIPWKRHDEFVRAFGALCELEISDHARRPDGPGSTVVELGGLVPARAVVVGADVFGEHGRYVFDLKKLADELVGERVVFTGWRDDIARLLPAFDAFVSASDKEPFGRALVEAMASGLPVVTSDSGAKGEIVIEGVTGFVVPQGDIAAMAKAMHTLRHDSKLRGQMGLAGRTRALELFSVERTAREVEAVYREILDR